MNNICHLSYAFFGFREAFAKDQCYKLFRESFAASVLAFAEPSDINSLTSYYTSGFLCCSFHYKMWCFFLFLRSSLYRRSLRLLDCFTGQWTKRLAICIPVAFPSQSQGLLNEGLGVDWAQGFGEALASKRIIPFGNIGNWMQSAPASIAWTASLHWKGEFLGTFALWICVRPGALLLCIGRRVFEPGWVKSNR